MCFTLLKPTKATSKEIYTSKHILVQHISVRTDTKNINHIKRTSILFHALPLVVRLAEPGFTMDGDGAGTMPPAV